jgi:hypothetical protein
VLGKAMVCHVPLQLPHQSQFRSYLPQYLYIPTLLIDIDRSLY